MKSFASILEQVTQRFGSAADLQLTLPEVATAAQLAAVTDDRYLSLMCLRIFRAGLKHSMVDARWPSFEQVYHGFAPAVLTRLGDEQLEQRMAQEGIIRHWRKTLAIRDNAAFVLEVSRQEGGFGHWLANWPCSDIIGLWAQLKSRGSQLGGNSGPMLLRMAGKDSFVLSEDVVLCLQRQGVIDRKPTSRKALAAVQAAFNQWHDESGWHYSHISRVLAFSVGPQ